MNFNEPVSVTKIKSSDGAIFIVPNLALQRCETMESMIKLCSDDTNDEIVLETIHSKYLKPIVDWLQHNSTPQMKNISEMFQLIIAINFLNIPDLLELSCNMAIEMLDQSEYYNESHINFDVTTKPKCCFSDCSLGASTNQLRVCGKCKIAKYCSKDCQANDWNEHKGICKLIAKETRKMDRLATPLRNYTDLGDRPENLFETSVGRFWGLVDPRDYCRSRFALCEQILKLADKKRLSYLYEIVLAHYLGLMRLIHGDNMGLRDHAPFIFLKLNREDDCYNFIKWWQTIDPTGNYDWGDVPPSNEGDWLYLTGQDKFEDPCETWSINFKIALLCIKLRIVARYEARLVHVNAKIQEAATDEGMGPLTDVLPVFRKCVVGDAEKLHSMHQQSVQATNLLKDIKESSKVFLPAVLNPGPLMSLPHPSSHSQGSTEEAWLALDVSFFVINSIPGALDKIKAVVGTDTKYNATFSDSDFFQ